MLALRHLRERGLAQVVTHLVDQPASVAVQTVSLGLALRTEVQLRLVVFGAGTVVVRQIALRDGTSIPADYAAGREVSVVQIHADEESAAF